MNAHRRLRRTVPGRSFAVVAASAMLFAGVACSGDDGDDATATTTSDGTETEQTTTTLSDEEYAEVADELSAQLDAAGSDICALVEAQGIAVPPEPANSAQAEVLIGVSAQVLRSFATALSDTPESQAVLTEAADEMEADAAAAGYPLDYISNPDSLPPSLSSEEFTAAIEQVSQLAQQQCMPEQPELPTEGFELEDVPLEGEG